MVKHKEYLSSLLGEADAFEFKIKESEPDAEVVFNPDKDYKATPNAEIEQVEDESRTQKEESYTIQTILDKAEDIFRYVVTEVLYQYIKAPMKPEMNGGLNFISDANTKTLTVTIDMDNESTFKKYDNAYDIDTIVNVFKKVLKDKMKSKFKIDKIDKAPINLGRLDAHRILTDVVIQITTVDPKDITDLGDDQRLAGNDA